MMCKRPTNVGFYGQSLSCSWTLLSLLLYSHWLLHILVEKALIETLTLPLKPENIKSRWAPVYEAISSPQRPTATSSLSHPISRLSSAVLSKWGHENEQKHNLQKKKKKICRRCPEQTRFHLEEETKLLSSARLQLLAVSLPSADEGRKIKAPKNRCKLMETRQTLQAAAAFWTAVITWGGTFNSCQFFSHLANISRFSSVLIFTSWRSFIWICSSSSASLISTAIKRRKRGWRDLIHIAALATGCCLSMQWSNRPVLVSQITPNVHTADGTETVRQRRSLLMYFSRSLLYVQRQQKSSSSCFFFFNYKQARNGDREMLTQTTPSIRWLQLTRCCFCPVRRKLKKPIKIGFLPPAAVSQESESGRARARPCLPAGAIDSRVDIYLQTSTGWSEEKKKIKAVGCLMTE